jgi:hypothetical protein
MDASRSGRQADGLERHHQGDQATIVTLTRVSRWLRRVTRRDATLPPAQAVSQSSPQTPQPGPPEQWADQLALAHSTEAAWLDARRARGRLYADLSNDRVASLSARFPAQAARTRASAERVLRHEFDLLGSGWCVPADPARPRLEDGYQPIDWALDPIAGLRFPTGFRYSDWNPQMRPGLADIKWPWEIGRCQHWVTLGQAFRLTGDERYAGEIVRQHADFMETNPVGVGVQYVCTMDVAIRAFNWALAFESIRASASFDSRAMAHAYRSLFDVGVFIERNLENKYEVTSNHFLSNVVGLYALGVVFADLPLGQRWLREGREWLEQEMKVQVLDDGADYESSVPYHRLVLELFLAGERLSELAGAPLSESYRTSLERMSTFMVAVLRPDGLLPQVGDADDGRLHIFSDYGVWQPQDARHILGPAALMFTELSWIGLAGDAGLWEAAWWGYDIDDIRMAAMPAVNAARLFEHAGVAVVKTDRAYLLITNGRVGTNGFGNHKHNDLLGFEFHAEGAPLLVDPGSYVYTSNPDARNRFRGTAYHNTLQVDGIEQNDLRPDYLFRMFETSSVEHLAFDDTTSDAEYRGRHTGYERLTEPVAHERTFRLAKSAGALVVTDRLLGSGRHHLAWHFHLAPGVHVEPVESAGGLKFALVTGKGRWLFRAAKELTATIVDAWYSPSYGVRIACRAIDFTTTADLPGNRAYTFAIGPEVWMDSADA